MVEFSQGYVYKRAEAPNDYHKYFWINYDLQKSKDGERGVPATVANSTFSGIMALAVVALTVTALVEVSHNKEYDFKCGEAGENFFKWMIARLCLIIAENLIIMLLSSVALCILPPSFPVLILVLKCVSATIYLALGVIFTNEVMLNQACVDAMSNSSFTHSPLLMIMGWVYVGVDALLVLMYIVGSCFTCCFFSLALTLDAKE